MVNCTGSESVWNIQTGNVMIWSENREKSIRENVRVLKVMSTENCLQGLPNLSLFLSLSLAHTPSGFNLALFFRSTQLCLSFFFHINVEINFSNLLKSISQRNQGRQEIKLWCWNHFSTPALPHKCKFREFHLSKSSLKLWIIGSQLFLTTLFRPMFNLISK